MRGTIAQLRGTPEWVGYGPHLGHLLNDGRPALPVILHMAVGGRVSFGWCEITREE